jgi:hypothetical protein
MDGNVYHNWQLSAGGAWSGWQSLGASSDSAGTDTAEDVYFLSDADNEANYASRQSQQCPSNIPNLWRGPLNGRTYAWPCGAIVNIGLSSYKHLKPFNGAIANWNKNLAAYYAQYAQGGATPLPAGLSISAGGPQTISVYPACDTCIPGANGGYGRGQNTSFAFDPSNRLLHVDIQLIKGMTNGTALKDTFAHELGHSFGLLDCDVSAQDGGGNPLYDCGKSVMATNISVSAHGWDYWAKNASNGATPSGANIKLLPGPTICDLSVIDQGLPDYRQCFKMASLPPDTPTCTNGTAAGFADTAG